MSFRKSTPLKNKREIGRQTDRYGGIAKVKEDRVENERRVGKTQNIVSFGYDDTLQSTKIIDNLLRRLFRL